MIDSHRTVVETVVGTVSTYCYFFLSLLNLFPIHTMGELDYLFQIKWEIQIFIRNTPMFKR